MSESNIDRISRVIVKQALDFLDYINHGQIPQSIIELIKSSDLKKLAKQIKQELERRGDLD